MRFSRGLLKFLYQRENQLGIQTVETFSWEARQL